LPTRWSVQGRADLNSQVYPQKQVAGLSVHIPPLLTKSLATYNLCRAAYKQIISIATAAPASAVISA